VGEGRGVLLYLNQEGRGIGLANKIRAYALQDEGLDTVEANERLGFKADQRDYGIGVQILRALGVRSMRLLSNNPRKLVAIEGYGLSVTEWLPLEIPASTSTLRYLTTKKNKLGHALSGSDSLTSENSRHSCTCYEPDDSDRTLVSRLTPRYWHNSVNAR
jgi:3,4-dihydroxy 2-butanone 4-phosphate synthase / GTP cyclohydrolase II